MPTPIEYLSLPGIKDRISLGPVYQKTAVTLLRKITPEEEGKQLTTYVKNENGTLRFEIGGVMSSSVSVLARNAGVIGTDDQGNEIFNEWLVPAATAIKNYGQGVYDGLTTEFVGHKKKATLRAIQMDAELVELFKSMDCVNSSEEVMIKVSWSDTPELAKEGDWLTDQGYSISAHNMGDYGVVSPPKRGDFAGVLFPSAPIPAPELHAKAGPIHSSL